MSQLIVVLCLYESFSLKAFLTEKRIMYMSVNTFYAYCHIYIGWFCFFLAYELHDLHIIFINTLKVVVCP